MNEFEIIKSYFQSLAKKNPNSKKLNDDIFYDKKNKLAVSIDTYNQGIHFLNFRKPDLVIKKIIRSSISDLICKGVRPKYYFISASGSKKHFQHKYLKLIKKSLEEEQRKFDILLSGGDTTKSNNLSFSITSIGFARQIVERNKAKINDDIYVTGNIGDSFLGLQLLKKKFKLAKAKEKYFINKYYLPSLPINFSKNLVNFGNTSIDISDGLIADMKRLLNKQDLSFEIWLDKIPISNHLRSYINNNNQKKSEFLFNGDDYQILFTSSKENRKLIKNFSKNMNQKVTIIGQINQSNENNRVIDQNNVNFLGKYEGYLHKF